MLPYNLDYTHPLSFGRPRIHGAPCRTEYLAVHEDLEVFDRGQGLNVPLNGQGRWIEFTRDGIVTGVKLVGSVKPPNSEIIYGGVPFYMTADVVKDGKTHLSTDGERIRPLAVTDIGFWGEGFVQTWIPVSQWEKWLVSFRAEAGLATIAPPEVDAVLQYEFVVRVEYFDSPPTYPKDFRKSTTRFYKCEGIVLGNTVGAAEQLDFEREGVVTGFRALTENPFSITQAYSLAFDVLQDGKFHLTGQARNAAPPSQAGLTPPLSAKDIVWQPCYFPTRERLTWEVFPTNRGAEPVPFHFLARVEEFCR